MKQIPGLAGYFRELAAQAILESLDDGQLLDRFVGRRDEAAFARLVDRHGPMVLGVCRRLLRDSHDADDAFQATFLVLAKRAESVRPRDRVGAWLHGVARRSALKLRADRIRRSAGQYRLPTENSPPDTAGMELLDEELGRLPAIYRSALVLCELEGRTLKEASALLNLPPGTLASRVARGRELLARRVRARGLPAIVGAGLLAVPTSELLAATARNLLTPSANGAAFGIAQGVTTAMLYAKVQSVLAIAFGAAATVGIAAGVGFGQVEKPAKTADPVAPKAAVVGKALPPSSVDEEKLLKTPFDSNVWAKEWKVFFDPLTKMVPAEGDDELTAIRKRCLTASAKQVALLFARVELGKDPLLNVLLGIGNLTKCRLELCRTDEQRKAVLAEQCGMYSAVNKLTAILVDAGSKPEQDLHQVEFYRWDAKLQLRKLELAMAN